MCAAPFDPPRESTPARLARHTACPSWSRMGRLPSGQSQALLRLGRPTGAAACAEFGPRTRFDATNSHATDTELAKLAALGCDGRVPRERGDTSAQRSGWSMCDCGLPCSWLMTRC